MFPFTRMQVEGSATPLPGYDNNLTAIACENANRRPVHVREERAHNAPDKETYARSPLSLRPDDRARAHVAADRASIVGGVGLRNHAYELAQLTRQRQGLRKCK